MAEIRKVRGQWFAYPDDRNAVGPYSTPEQAQEWLDGIAPASPPTDAGGQLLPCPFCGVTPVIRRSRDWLEIEAEHAEACVLDDGWGNDWQATDEGLAAAIAAWNRRTPTVRAVPNESGAQNREVSRHAKGRDHAEPSHQNRPTTSPAPAEPEPVAWETWQENNDGEVARMGTTANRDYADQWAAYNAPKFRFWTVPLYRHPAPAEQTPEVREALEAAVELMERDVADLDDKHKKAMQDGDHGVASAYLTASVNAEALLDTLRTLLSRPRDGES